MWVRNGLFIAPIFVSKIENSLVCQAVQGIQFKLEMMENAIYFMIIIAKGKLYL